MSKKNFAIDDKVYVVLNRLIFAVANTCPNYQQPPDEKFVAPAVVRKSVLVTPGDGNVAVGIDLRNVDDTPEHHTYMILGEADVFDNENDANEAAKAYNLAREDLKE